MQVSELWRYPVKSMAGHAVDAVDVDDLGLALDRRWGVVDLDSGLVLTARRVPALLHAAPVVDDAVVAGGRPDIGLPDGTLATDDAALSAWLGRDVTLRAPDDDERGWYEIAEDDEDPGSDWVRWHGPKGVWHDSTRTRLSIASRDGLGDRDRRRFRPNVVLDAGDERDLVDTDVQIGGVRLRVTKEIDRCVIVTRAQPGLDQDRSVLRDVVRDRAGNLGVGALVRGAGRLAVGDRVEILA